MPPVPPDIAAEFWKALDSVFGKAISAILLWLFGWITHSGWRKLSKRPMAGFWSPYLREGLVVLFGDLSKGRLQQFEPSGLVGVGDVFAFSEFFEPFQKTEQPMPKFAPHDTTDTEKLRSNLLCLGGQDMNQRTGAVLRGITTSLQFPDLTDPNQNGKVWAKDSVSGRYYGDSDKHSRRSPDEVDFDYCVLMKVKNPDANNKVVFLVFGGFGFGTWAGARFMASDSIWDAALEDKSPLVRWFHRIKGTIQGQYSGLPESFECVVEMKVNKTVPEAATSVRFRSLQT